MESGHYYRETIEHMFNDLEEYNEVMEQDDMYEEDDERILELRDNITEAMLILMLRKPADVRHKLLELFNFK